MRILTLLFLLSINFISNAQDIRQRIDSLIQNDEGALAIKLIDQYLENGNYQVYSTDLQLKKAEALILSQEYDQAQGLIKTMRAKKLSILEDAEIKIIEGSLELYQGKNDEALEILTSAEKIFRKEGIVNTLSMAKLLNYLGLTYYNSGKLAQAEEHILVALTIREKLLKEKHPLLAASYNDLGLVYSKSDPDKALSYYEKSLPIYQALYGKEHAKIAINNTNTGVIYRNLELYGDAINNLEASLSIWNKLSSKASPRKAFVLYQLGYTYQQMKNNKEAEVYYKQALGEYLKCYGQKHPDIASVLNALGNLERLKNNYEVALGYFQQALNSNLKNYNSTDISDIPKTQDFYNGNYLLYSLMYKAQTFESKHMGKSLKFSDLKLALQHLLACDSLIDLLRQQSNNETDKITLGIVANEVYADGVRITTHMSEIAFNKRKAYREKAFFFSEKSKSAVLLEAISEVNAKSFAGIPANLLAEEENFKSSITLVSQKLAQKPSADEESYLRETLYELNRQYQNFTSDLEKQYPDYYNLKFNTNSPSIENLQTLIDGKTAILSYFIDDSKVNDSHRLYIFTITKKQLSISTHTISSEFNKQITGFRNALYFNEPKTLKTVATKLHNTLIPFLPKNISSLVIFPTGRLGVIPFEALITKKVNDKTSHIPYLIEEYSIRYEFSAALAVQKTIPKEKVPQTILLCAPITFNEVDNLIALPGTEKEVNSISTLFNQGNTKASVFINELASEEMIKSDTPRQFDIIHMATHGIVDAEHPELSKIYLKNNTNTEDGYLYSGEIYNLKLNAALVTLSACQTGLGKIAKGEGVIGLSRALIYAGAKNIMVTFWSVADESTADLMTNFYKETLEQKSTFAQSLRQVKLNMINSKEYAAPYYWAPFVLIGF